MHLGNFSTNTICAHSQLCGDSCMIRLSINVKFGDVCNLKLTQSSQEIIKKRKIKSKHELILA